MSNQPLDSTQFDKGDNDPKFSDLFDAIGILGYGSFGTVVAARQKSNTYEYAVKVVYILVSFIPRLSKRDNSPKTSTTSL